jgi:hypothetical protein
VPKESEAKIGTPAEASNAALDPGAESADARMQRMAPVLLDRALGPLRGMKIGGVGRQPLHLELGVCLNRLGDRLRAMGIVPVTDDDEGAGPMSPEGTAGGPEVIAADGMREGPRVDATGPGDPAARGMCTARADAPQDRHVPLRSPCGPGLRPDGDAGPVDEHELRLWAARCCFMRGQAGRSRAGPRAASRCRAWTAGCCGRQPSACSRRAKPCSG